jgi:hypothetical protein
MNRWGANQLGELAFLAAGTALYAGEGANRDATSTSRARPRAWCASSARGSAASSTSTRPASGSASTFTEGLDLDAAENHWSAMTGIPHEQFRQPHRPKADPTMRTTKHEYGCMYVDYGCSRTHRQIMGLIRALLTSSCYSGVAQLVEQGPVKATAAGSSPAPGATPTLSSLFDSMSPEVHAGSVPSP